MAVHRYMGEAIEPCECGRWGAHWIIRMYRGDLMLADELSPHYSTLRAAREAITLARSSDGVASTRPTA